MSDTTEPRVFLEALRVAFTRWLRQQKNRREDRCVFFTKIAVEVCEEFGISAEPLSVTLDVFNAIMVRQIEEGRSPQLTSSLWLGAKFDPGAWGVGVDPSKPVSGPGWNGHLVALISGEPSFVLDLSQGQFSRPEYNMNYGPALLEFDHEADPPWEWTLPCGDRLIMRPCPGNKKWMTAPAWKLSAAGRRAIEQIKREVRMELGRQQKNA